MTIFACLKRVADLQLTFDRQQTSVHALHLIRVTIPVGLFCWDQNPQFGARLDRTQLLVQPVNYLSRSL